MKILGIVVAGVFAGVVIAEVLRKTCPETFENIENTGTGFVDSVKSAFKSGYEEAA